MGLYPIGANNSCGQICCDCKSCCPSPDEITRRVSTGLAQWTHVREILAVNNQLPVTTVKELIALAKAKPGQLNFASPGPGSPNHLGGELLKSMTGIEMVQCPTRPGFLLA